MSTLMTERRRPLENDDGQGELFAGDAFAPARPWDREPRARARERGAPPAFEAGAAETPSAEAAAPSASEPGDAGGRDSIPATPALAADVTDPSALGPGGVPTEVPSHDELLAGEELAALEQATVAADDVRSPRTPRARLAGPTLDDVMSRVWEGLTTGLPAACPICHGEVAPSLHGPVHGRCTSCGTTID